MNIESFRQEFLHPQENKIFLNHSGVSPLPRRTANTMKRVIQLNQTLTFEAWQEIQSHVGLCKENLAKLLHVYPDEIALTRNTTEGINWVANGIDWHPGDRIVSIHGEYPANIYPWMNLRKKGIIFHLVQPLNNRITPEMIEEAITPTTRLVTISQVQFTTGFHADLEAIGRLCKERNVFFMVDLIQGLGAVPVDLKKCHVSFAAGGAQKWLLGPQGAGFFYCSEECMEELDITCVGSDSVKQPLPYLDYQYELRQDAARFEYATLATVCVAGMNRSVQLLLEAGEEYIAQRIKQNTDILVEGAQQKGYHCHSPRADVEWSGIVAFTHREKPNAEVIARMQQANIFVLEREGMIRMAPHFYNTPEEMHRVIEVL